MIKPLIRHPRDDEDLSPLLGELSALQWNRESVWVAEVHGTLAGILITWDCGHSVVICDHLQVLPEYRQHGIGYWLVEAMEVQALKRGARAIFAMTMSPEMAVMAKRRRCEVYGPLFGIWYQLRGRGDGSPL